MKKIGFIKKKLTAVAVLTGLVVFIWVLPATAGDAPALINYQARLTNSSGDPIIVDTYDLRFTVMDAASGGSAVGSVDTHTDVTTTSAGLVNLQLIFPASSFTGSGARYLMVEVAEVSTFEELTPRQQLVSVPYALGGFACGTSTVTDADGNVYGTVQVGTQCWMATNLKYDGSTAGNGCAGVTWVNSSDEGWCGDYTGGPFADEGLLYQWSAAMNGDTQEGARGICPSGWHIPTDAEWYTLEDYLDSGTCDGTRVNAWSCDPAGAKLAGNAALWTNGALDGHADFGTSGFDALPAGHRSTDGSFNNRGDYTSLWSSTESSTSAWRRHLNYSDTTVYRITDSKAYGFSVRCLKD